MHSAASFINKLHSNLLGMFLSLCYLLSIHMPNVSMQNICDTKNPGNILIWHCSS